MLRHDDVASAFQKMLRQLAVAPDFIDCVLDRLEEVRQEKSHSRPDELKRREEAITSLAERRRRLYEMREDGTYDAESFRERLAAVDAEMGLLTVTAKEPDLSSINPEMLRDSARWFLGHVALIWEKLPDASRSRFEKIAFPDGIRYDRRTGFRTTIPGPVLAVSRPESAFKSHGVHFDGISSNQLYEYFKNLIALHSEMKDIPLHDADHREAA